ncbi:Uncharacterized [Moorella glycerini]|uniref:Uncharacterized protein n=1 Tax=Neomoorella stamsii TaxID=1266720 RepID=A0A9X7J3S5_9FIRM|nr:MULTISPECIES: hypothetical protein [Moorella]PRR72359.1 hypothetical protein MOST_20700 [Moorella stamsii]CEP67368.1 Uncharacterized [Moorella glycerini]
MEVIIRCTVIEIGTEENIKAITEEIAMLKAIGTPKINKTRKLINKAVNIY